MPGIITGVILGLERAAGETAPILFTVAAFFLPQLPTSILDQTMALPISPFCHQHPGARDALRHSVRHRARAARLRAVDESHCDFDPQPLSRQRVW
jgi:ABC-type phosphate transport system permease subunit